MTFYYRVFWDLDWDIDSQSSSFQFQNVEALKYQRGSWKKFYLLQKQRTNDDDLIFWASHENLIQGRISNSNSVAFILTIAASYLKRKKKKKKTIEWKAQLLYLLVRKVM